MSDDRSPVDGWFRDEPAGPPPQAGGYGTPDDTPTQAAGFPAVRPQEPPRPQPWHGQPAPEEDRWGAPTQPPTPMPTSRPIPAPTPAADLEHERWRGPVQPPFEHDRWGAPQGTAAAAGTAFGARESVRMQRPPQERQEWPERPNQSPPSGPGYPEYEPHPHDRRAQGRRTPLIAGGAVAGVAALALVAYLALGNHGGSSKSGGSSLAGAGSSPSPTHTSFQPTSTDPATAAEQTASAFLNAWQSGDLQEAAKYTDDPNSALATLTAYKSGLNLSALKLAPKPAVVAGATPSSGSSSSSSSSSSAASGNGSGPSGAVPFSVTATVGLSGQSAALPWTYDSSLTAFKQSDGWSVHWSPSILAPSLTDGEKLSVVAVPPGATKVTDAQGTKLSSYSESALQTINTSLLKKAPSGQGAPGVAVQITDASGKAVSGSTTTLKKAVDTGAVKTTISPTAESLARTAVGKFPRSSMVVLRPSTGAILAVANSSGSGDTALAGGLAPGSTFKIVTATALLNYGFVSLYTPIACPLTVDVQGVIYHNSTDSSGKNEESLPAGTPFLTDFAQSCNNAFTPFYKQLEGGKLAHTAYTYFGLDKPWDIGLGSNSYFSIPSGSSGAELAQENFGQGKIVASPLAMASVAATVGTGSFHQPYLVDGVTKATATALPSGVDANLKTMMHAVVTGGTAAGVFSHVSGTVYAKTGTADADANKDGKPNSWMVAYSPSMDIAIGVVVQDSGFGASYAGPEAAYVLSHL